MNRKFYLPLLALPLFFVSFTNNEGGGNQSKDLKKYNIANVDKSAKAGSDFYRYATGGWADANPLPAEYARYGSFDQLAARNQEQVKGLIEDLGKSTHKSGTMEQKIGDLYAMGMDSVKLNQEKATPILFQLSKINKAMNVTDLIKVSADLRQYANTPYFYVYVSADRKNSSMNIVNLSQGGLGLGNRDYYLEEDSTSVALRKGYLDLIKKQFVNIGYKAAEADKKANAVLRVETALAKAHIKKEDLRVPEKNYHKMSVAELDKNVGKFDWTTFFKAAKATGFTELNVSQIEPISEAVKIIQTFPLEDNKSYLAWCLVNASAGYLSDNIGKADFDFFGKQLSGRQVQQPRWKRAVNSVDRSLSEGVGQIYVAKYFPAEAKERMLKLVGNLQIAFGERIDKLDWMSDETKKKAHEKLNSFTVKIGYPDTWKDYSKLEIKKDSYWQNMVRANIWEYEDMMSRIGKPVDKTEWHMPPQMVNAYYNPTTNEICFPAGILQPPFFFMNGDDAVNYGAIGVVIGHEMTHGFDDQGSKFDKEGNMSNWWTEEDSKRFEERSKVLVNHFNEIEVLANVKANGTFTLGENIADYGGLQIAYEAYSKTEEFKKGQDIEGFTPQQRFFLAYAGVWAGNIRDEEILRRTKMDVHSLGKWRVNGALPNIDAWYTAFDITKEDPLFISKEKRADIW